MSSKQLSVCSLSVLWTNSQNSQFIQTRFKHRPLTIRALKKDVYFTSGQELKAWVSWIFEAPGYGTNMWQNYSASLNTNCTPCINPLFSQQSHRFPLINIFVSILICNWVKGHSYTNIHQRLITTLYRGRCVHFTLFMKDYNDVMDVKLLNEANRYHLMWGINHLRIRHLKLIYTLLPIPKKDLNDI